VADNVTIGLVLIITGLILIAIEIAHPGVFLVVPGTVVGVAGLLYTFVPMVLTASVFGPLIVAAAAILAGIITIPYYQRLGAIHRPLTTIPETLQGETGLVLAPVVPDSLRGKVRIRSEVWSARSDRPIPAGVRVRVLGGQGVSVIVEPVETDPNAPGKAA
jgi:membrane protein implicated in regulation of membrane protease activity